MTTHLMVHKIPPLNKTLAEVADMVGGRAEGDSRFVVEHPATLQDAGPKDISFLGNPKYAAAAAQSAAGCLLLPATGPGASVRARNRIFVEDPQFAFAQLLLFVESQKPKAPAVHDAKASIHYQAKLGPNVSVGAFTVIERGAHIGEGTAIGAQCYIGERVKIGRHSKIYPQVVIREDCVIGERVIIHPGVVIGGDGFGFSPDKKTGLLRKIPQLGNVAIGDDVEIGSNAAIDRAMVGTTTIGAGTKIDNLVQIAHGVKIGKGCILVSQVGIAGSTELGNHVVLGGQVGLVGHIKLGDGVQAGAQSGIMADIPKGTIVFGYPARPHRESFKLQALYGRLPEFYEALKTIQKKLGLETKKKSEVAAQGES
ncbi:MAG: UDP-3-O-(3-hydroxymyristoyl)glucosamine N-acyltransferase [Elusimicrobia bacterium]|nr:UDP-3-O-(3-hydroxymyristoyl)glucosamine N-acyltransferase [Elusimicrobiota bacterium]